MTVALTFGVLICVLMMMTLKEVFSFMDRRWFDHKDERSAAEKSGSLLLSLRYLTVNWRRRLEDITEATIAEYVDGNNRIAIRQHPEHGFYMLFNAVDEDLSAHREERSNPRTVSIGEDDLQL